MNVNPVQTSVALHLDQNFNLDLIMRLIGPSKELQTPVKVKGYYNSEDKKDDKVDIQYIPFSDSDAQFNAWK